MKIRFFSDLHNEFGPFLVPAHIDDADTVLVLAGDIEMVHRKEAFKSFFECISLQFKHVIYVFGNHEFYKSFLPTAHAVGRELVSHLDNVHILENETFELNDVVFVGATLWTDFDNNNPITMFDGERFMSDYRLIRTGPISTPWMRKLSAADIYMKHTKSVSFIDKACTEATGKKIIVVTHHSPSFQSVTEGFQGNSLNGLYHSNLENLILKHQPCFWIHGHIHQSITYNIGETTVTTNPRGYYGSADLNSLFDPHKFIEVG